MRTFFLIVLISLGFPVAGYAQRGGGRGGGGRGAGSGNRLGTQQRQFTTKSLAELNPARVLLDRKKELSLDDGERARLDSVAGLLDARTSVQMKRADSLQRVIAAGGGGGMSRAAIVTKADTARRARQDSLVERAQVAHRDLLTTLTDIKQSFDSSAARSVAALTTEHRAKGDELVGWAIEDVANVLRQASAPGNTGRRGGD